jgi:hypothetical protein
MHQFYLAAKTKTPTGNAYKKWAKERRNSVVKDRKNARYPKDVL